MASRVPSNSQRCIPEYVEDRKCLGLDHRYQRELERREEEQDRQCELAAAPAPVSESQ